MTCPAPRREGDECACSCGLRWASGEDRPPCRLSDDDMRAMYAAGDSFAQIKDRAYRLRGKMGRAAVRAVLFGA